MNECPIHGKDCKDFRKGCIRGFDPLGETIKRNEVVSECFRKGFVVGRREIDAAADEAFQSQYSLNG